MNTKIIAFYLPQFHAIPENDHWWGKGFTDWTNVRKARPLFKGHDQPRVPQNERYYDLSRVETLRWQAELANSHGIYGMCFYHYWFAGKLLLQKPAELLLSHKDLPMRFCFSWANEPWARTWDGYDRQVLMPQDYGTEEDWRKHFNYLLPFFKDDRYIKVDGRPMMLLYRSLSIPCCAEMMALWETMARDNGLPGLHFVCTLGHGHDYKAMNQDLPFSAYVEFEPVRTTDMEYHSPWVLLRGKMAPMLNRWLHTRILPRRPYRFSDVADNSLRLKSPEGTYGGIFCGWDNTPRKKSNGMIIEAPTRDEFASYLEKKIRQTHDEYHTDFLFVNAWNEWAEGTYLEPDKTRGCMYLDVIRDAVGSNS
ncbi:MAG: glycoside hydrolase family 99-like domain-containing protein [Prevotella sp.]|nr:glycoside hydrolase family 99-like domain-containing protein [Prevotella sp.]